MRLSCWVLFFAVGLAGCSTLSRLDAVPTGSDERATVLGRDDLRYWPGRDIAGFVEDMDAALDRERAALAAAGHTGPLPPVNFLAVSGGGEDGAFGAGLLVGWTAAGTRPQFKGVTGISTGALTAPFAFLGPDYDDKLRAVYTEISAKDVLTPRSAVAIIFQDAAADTSPLRQTIARYFDAGMLAAIAAEHGKGRILLIGTTNLDARQPIIWNIGKIAASGDPGSLDLIHSILVASAAIPGAFPPVLIDAELDGTPHQEMHVDGGASAQVFLYPPSLDVRARDAASGTTRERHVYIIRNARLDPDWAQVQRRTFSIASRAISSLIQTQGIGDLYRIYVSTQRDGLKYNLAYIPETFRVPLTEPFDTEYMRQLFDVGYGLGRDGYEWRSTPPGYTAPTPTPAAVDAAS